MIGSSASFGGPVKILIAIALIPGSCFAQEKSAQDSYYEKAESKLGPCQELDSGRTTALKTALKEFFTAQGNTEKKSAEVAKAATNNMIFFSQHSANGDLGQALTRHKTQLEGELKVSGAVLDGKHAAAKTKAEQLQTAIQPHLADTNGPKFNVAENCDGTLTSIISLLDRVERQTRANRPLRY